MKDKLELYKCAAALVCKTKNCEHLLTHYVNHNYYDCNCDREACPIRTTKDTSMQLFKAGCIPYRIFDKYMEVLSDIESFEVQFKDPIGLTSSWTSPILELLGREEGIEWH
jgi:hypothetical protein